MKKWKRLCAVMTAACMIVVALPTQAAVLDDQTPLEGDYLLVYNDNPNPQGAAERTGELPKTASQSVENSIHQADEDGPQPVDMGSRAGEIMEAAGERDENDIQRNTSSFSFVGQTRNFATIDFVREAVVPVVFTLKYSGTHANVWLANDQLSQVTDEQVNQIGTEFDRVHDQITDSFGNPYDMDGDGKTAFLLYDIQDGFTPPSGSYYAGFFTSADYTASSGNHMDVLHIDTYPGISKPSALKTGVEGAQSTLVHEYQHLLEFSYCYLNNKDVLPTWINEGLSMAAEDMIYGTLTSRINYYYNTLKGHPLFAWQEEGDVLSNYSLSYLFFQYLKYQTQDLDGGGTELYRRIIEATNRSSGAVAEAMQPFQPGVTLSELLRNFRLANFLKEPEGLFGYQGQGVYNDLPSATVSANGEVGLLPGGSIVMKLNGPFTPSRNAGAHIKFCAFSEGNGLPEGAIDLSTVDSSGDGYTYDKDNQTLKLTGPGPFVIGQTSQKPVAKTISVETSLIAYQPVSVTLSGVNVDVSWNRSASALTVADNTAVSILLENINTLASGQDAFDIQGGSGSSITISGRGTLKAAGIAGDSLSLGTGNSLPTFVVQAGKPLKLLTAISSGTEANLRVVDASGLALSEAPAGTLVEAAAPCAAKFHLLNKMPAGASLTNRTELEPEIETFGVYWPVTGTIAFPEGTDFIAGDRVKIDRGTMRIGGVSSFDVKYRWFIQAGELDPLTERVGEGEMNEFYTPQPSDVGKYIAVAAVSPTADSIPGDHNRNSCKGENRSHSLFRSGGREGR